MLKINQTVVENVEELNLLNTANHASDKKNAVFEYLPSAKGTEYEDLVSTDFSHENILFFSISAYPWFENGESDEIIKQAMVGNIPMRIMTAVRRCFESNNKYGELLSVSFNPKLNKNKQEGIIVHALIRRRVQFTPDEIDAIGQEILNYTDPSAQAKFSHFADMPIQFNEDRETERMDEVIVQNEEAYKQEDNTENRPADDAVENNRPYTRYVSDESEDDDETNWSYSTHYNNEDEKSEGEVEEYASVKESVKEPVDEYNEGNDGYYEESASEESYDNSDDDYTDDYEDMLFTSEISKDRITASDISENNFQQDKVNKIDVEKPSRYSDERKSASINPGEIKPAQDAIKKHVNNTDDDVDSTANDNMDSAAGNVRMSDVRNAVRGHNNGQTRTFRMVKDEASSSQIQKRGRQKKDIGLHDDSSANFIESFCRNIDCSDVAVDLQREAYNNSSTEAPFLNAVSEYVPQNDIRALEAPAPQYEIYEEDEFIQTTASKQKIKQMFERVLNYFMESEHTTIKKVLHDTDPEVINNFMFDIKNYIDRYLQVPVEDMDMFMNKIKRAFFSYYVLTPAIKDPDVTDIRVLSPDNINVKVKGKHYTASGLKFINANDYVRYIEGLIIRNRLSTNFPIIVFTDKDYDPDYILRFNLCMPEINSMELPYLHIRKVPKEKTTLADLVNKKMLNTKIAAYLLDKVINSRGIVVSGPSASGKTTLLNALVDYIPKTSAIFCAQESEELFSNIHPDAYFQHVVKDRFGEIKIGLSELCQNGLLCDSEYFLIGEVKGKEARDMLRASNTGHKCWCSVHAQSAEETISRLADYVKYGSDYSLSEAERMLKDFEVIVYIRDFKIQEISEIAGYDDKNNKIIYRPIYKRCLDCIAA